MNKTIIPTIEQLRKSGNKCRVSHFRYSLEDWRKVPTKQLKKQKDKYLYHQRQINGKFRSPVGGMTKIDVTFINGREVSAEAYCSPLDQFNKKRGVAIALGRIYAKLENGDYNEKQSNP